MWAAARQIVMRPSPSPAARAWPSGAIAIDQTEEFGMSVVVVPSVQRRDLWQWWYAERDSLLTGGQVPQLYRPIVAASRQRSSVREERSSADCCRVLAERILFATRGNVIESDPVVAGSYGQRSAIGSYGQGINPFGRHVDLADLHSGHDIPHPHGLIIGP